MFRFTRKPRTHSTSNHMDDQKFWSVVDQADVGTRLRITWPEGEGPHQSLKPEHNEGFMNFYQMLERGAFEYSEEAMRVVSHVAVKGCWEDNSRVVEVIVADDFRPRRFCLSAVAMEDLEIVPSPARAHVEIDAGASPYDTGHD